jgi:ubiquinol-cytochrome c reductase cytochrome b/c1 subunit
LLCRQIRFLRHPASDIFHGRRHEPTALARQAVTPAMGDTLQDIPDESLESAEGAGLQDVGLILAVGILLAGLFLAGPISPAKLAAAFYLALFVHIWASAYDGRFGGWRTVTWVLLIAAWVGAEVAGFLGMVMPRGQFSFWLSSTIGSVPLIGGWLSRLLAAREAMPGAASLGCAALILVLVLDILAMLWPRWRHAPWTRRILFPAAAVVAAWILAPLISQFAPEAPPDGVRLLPDWYMLPLYAMLRSVPDKLAGIVLVFAAMLVPLVLPWARIDRLRGHLAGGLWLVLSLALAGCWIGLGLLGTLPPDAPALSAAPALAAFHFAYFLVFPLLLRGLARTFRGRGEQARTVP